jgi:hypothetical protein
VLSFVPYKDAERLHLHVPTLKFYDMLHIKSRFLAIRSLVCVAACATLFSFSAEPGRDSFKVYLGDKLMLEEYVSAEANVKSFNLDERFEKDDVKVTYSHCGRIGQARNLLIKDVQGKVLKEWHFPDAAEGVVPSMTFKAKDVLGLKKDGTRLNLVYSSKEIPNGQLLAVVVLDSDNKVSLK